MPDHRLTKIICYPEMQNDKRLQCSQKKLFRDTRKTFVKDAGKYEAPAQDRTVWQTSLHKSAATWEQSRTLAVEQRRLASNQEH